MASTDVPAEPTSASSASAAARILRRLGSLRGRPARDGGEEALQTGSIATGRPETKRIVSELVVGPDVWSAGLCRTAAHIAAPMPPGHGSGRAGLRCSMPARAGPHVSTAE